MNILNTKILKEIALECNISPTILEKDWYLVSALRALQAVNIDDACLVFAGGTSLAKGYGLISRFSDDIDFVVLGAENLNRNKRGKFRKFLIEKLTENTMFSIDFERIFIKDENRFFNFFVDYPKTYSISNILREGIKIEITVKPTYLDPIFCEVKTFIDNYIDNAPTAYIPCVSPVETAANKFCGLLWRLDREHKNYLLTGKQKDKSLMRHLHDLSALYPIIVESTDFIPLIVKIYEIDKIRGDKKRDLSLIDFIEQIVDLLKNDTIYRQNYENYVKIMCYGNADIISFDEAINHYESLCSYVIGNNLLQISTSI